ncbi:MAG: sensor histidine kinase [Spirochaetia bacterium]|nr:sensor histidine kinase [Spirochaetia bacterium]
MLLVNVKSVDIKGGTRLYTFRDITELSRKEDKLRRSEQMYRELSAHLQNIREEQNAELSREIHDDLGQSLTALKMNVTFLEQCLEDENPDKENLQKAVHDMERIITTTVKKVRKISTELRPSVIDAEGLIEALKWQVEEFKKNFNISVTLSTLKRDVDLGKQKSLHVFRIVQESLTNCVRHSGATKVHISTAIKNGILSIEVKDNGYGFNVDEIEGSMSFGFIGMKERAKQCAGTLDIESTPGTGTTVKLTIPVSENEVQ